MVTYTLFSLHINPWVKKQLCCGPSLVTCTCSHPWSASTHALFLCQPTSARDINIPVYVCTLPHTILLYCTCSSNNTPKPLTPRWGNHDLLIVQLKAAQNSLSPSSPSSPPLRNIRCRSDSQHQSGDILIGQNLVRSSLKSILSHTKAGASNSITHLSEISLMSTWQMAVSVLTVAIL